MKKYQNIFWHQGIKIYEDNEIKDKKNLQAIDHLENDVTKSFLNILQYTDPIVIKTIIENINRKNNTTVSLKSKIQYDFQITDKSIFTRYPHKFFLTIISQLTPIDPKDAKFVNEWSIPDAAIFDDETVLLIEVKTQSPLSISQIQSHIANFVPNATEISFYWEEIFDVLLELRDKLNEKDRFLIKQFYDYLDMIDLSNFHKFTEDDFRAFKHPKKGGSYNADERLDRLKKVKNKILKLDRQIWERLSFKEKRFGRVNQLYEYLWFGYYPNTIEWINLNFFMGKFGFHIVANAEKKDTFSKYYKQLKKYPEKFDRLIPDIDLDFNVLLYTQLPLQPEIQGNYYMKRVARIPKQEITATKILNEIESIKGNLDKYKIIMFEEIKRDPLKNSQKNIDYLSKTFFGEKKQKMIFNSKCALRFNYLIPRTRVINMEHDELIANIIQGSIEMKKLVDFGNAIE
jgi:hypothetical protein